MMDGEMVVVIETVCNGKNIGADDKVYTIPYANIRKVRLVCEDLAGRAGRA